MATPNSVPQHDEADPIAVAALDDLNVRANERMELETRNATSVPPVSGGEGEGNEPPSPYVGSPERSDTVNSVSYLRALSPERPSATNSVASDPSAAMNALGFRVLTDSNALAPVPVT